MEKKQQIQALTAFGWTDRAISRATGIYRSTVAKYRKAYDSPQRAPIESVISSAENQPEVPTDSNVPSHQNQPNVPADLPVLPTTNSTQIQPHTQKIRDALLQKLTAQRIYQDLVEEHGYTGSYDAVKRYARKLRKKVRGFTDRLEHLPGKEAQVDFGKATCRILIGNKWKRVWFFKMTLSCSKHSYEELVERQDLETFLRCHERAFASFGGVPEIVTIDNLKAGVIEASIFDPILNETYLKFATHWGFAANPCMPFRPEHKGVVERDVSYTKHNALDGRRFDSLSEANAYLRHWNKRWARTRIHGTTRCQVWKLFCDIERPRLRSVAEKPFEFFNTCVRKVDVNGCVEVKGGFYRVPPRFVGDKLVVHYNLEYVRVYAKGLLAISHMRLERKGAVSEALSCLPKWKHPNLESQERYYCRKAQDLSPALHKLVYEVLCTDDPLAIRRVRGILSVAKKYTSDTLEAAARSALGVTPVRFTRFKGLCEKYAETPDTDTPTLTQNHELIRSLDEYETLITERTSL
jgi:transposase